jgi:hypothetical protein
MLFLCNIYSTYYLRISICEDIPPVPTFSHTPNGNDTPTNTKPIPISTIHTDVPLPPRNASAQPHDPVRSYMKYLYLMIHIPSSIRMSQRKKDIGSGVMSM